jgi:signal transduction histidine kinase
VLRELDRLRVEIEGLRAARKRLVLAADADRRTIERDLHDGVHQHLVALATKLQLAEQAAGSDPAAAKTLLEEMRRDVQHALDETALLVQRIYPAMLEVGGLAALLRSAAVNAGVPASIDVAADSNHSPEVGMTVYLCWLAVLARESGEGRVTIRVHESDDALAFEVTGKTARSDLDLERVRDRVEALGGRLTIGSRPDRSISISGSLPVPR